MTALTERQAEVLAFIRKFQASHGAGPSVREIGSHCGIISPNAVAGHIKALEKKGFLKRARSAHGRALSRAYVIHDGNGGVP